MTTKQHLTQLETSGLLRLAQTHPELEYLFRHALVQDAAYKSLLREDRKHLHQKVAETLEQLYPDKLDDLAAILGQHFALAGDNPRALKYFTLAGDAAAATYANAEAVAHYTQALALTRQVETDAQDLTYLYTRLGRVLEVNAQFDDAMANYEDMEQRANQRDDQPMRLAALMAQMTLYLTPNIFHEPARGQAVGEEVLTLTRNLGDQTSEVKTLWNLALSGMWSGRTFKGIEYGEQAVTLARQLDQPELLAFALNDLGMLYLSVTHLKSAKAALDEANKLWHKLDNLPMLTDNLNIACATAVIAGDYDQGLVLADEAFQISETSNNLWGQSFSRMMAGWAYWEQGQPDLAIAASQESLQLGTSAGFIGAQVLAGGTLADVYAGLGAIGQGMEIAQLAVIAAKTQFPHFHCHPLGVLAQIHLLAGNLAEAKTLVEQGKNDPYRDAHPTWNMRINVAEAELALRQGDYEQTIAMTDDWLSQLQHNSLRTYILIMLRLQSRALLSLGYPEAAQERLLEACSMAKAIGARRALWQTLATLAQIAAATGQPDEADQLRTQAREIVEFISGHISDPELQASFHNAEWVREVWTDLGKV